MTRTTARIAERGIAYLLETETLEPTGNVESEIDIVIRSSSCNLARQRPKRIGKVNLERVPPGCFFDRHAPDAPSRIVSCQARRVLPDYVRGRPEANARTQSHKERVLGVPVLLRAW